MLLIACFILLSDDSLSTISNCNTAFYFIKFILCCWDFWGSKEYICLYNVLLIRTLKIYCMVLFRIMVLLKVAHHDLKLKSCALRLIWVSRAVSWADRWEAWHYRPGHQRRKGARVTSPCSGNSGKSRLAVGCLVAGTSLRDIHARAFQAAAHGTPQWGQIWRRKSDKAQVVVAMGISNLPRAIFWKNHYMVRCLLLFG
jgi:hypothetical protein